MAVSWFAVAMAIFQPDTPLSFTDSSCVDQSGEGGGGWVISVRMDMRGSICDLCGYEQWGLQNSESQTIRAI